MGDAQKFVFEREAEGKGFSVGGARHGVFVGATGRAYVIKRSAPDGTKDDVARIIENVKERLVVIAVEVVYESFYRIW